MRFKSFGFCENSSKSGAMTRLFWVPLLATVVLGSEGSPFFLELLAELSAEKVSAGNNRAKMRAQKSSCRRVEKDLLNNLMGFFTFLGSTARPLNFRINSMPRFPEWQTEKDAVLDGRMVIVMLEVIMVNSKQLKLEYLVCSL